MLKINDIIRPLPIADEEYSVCGTVMQKAKVIDTFERQVNGNNVLIEILEHINPNVIGKKYRVDDRYFEAIEQDWIWIDAFKATDGHMCCKGMQYYFDEEIHFDGTPVLGVKGYHVCTALKHCFKTYDYNWDNRFFRVRALVKATDYQYVNPKNTTLVAKAIEFIEEITYEIETFEAKRDAINDALAAKGVAVQ